MSDNIEKDISDEDVKELENRADVEYEKVVGNINYLLSIHNALFKIVLGTHPQNKELLIVPEESYMAIIDSISGTAERLVDSVGLSINPIEEESFEEAPKHGATDAEIVSEETFEPVQQEESNNETGESNE